MTAAPARRGPRRRFILAAEIALILALGAWVAWTFIPRAPEPPGSISVKVQLPGALDRAHLTRNADGTLLYVLTTTEGARVELTPDEFAQRLHAAQSSRSWLDILLNTSSPAGFTWVAIGLLGQVLFTGRMVVQWIVSEKRGASTVPTAFWWMSLLGATMLLTYFIWRKDAVGVLGQGFGWFIYVRNLWLIHGAAPRAPDAFRDPAPEPELATGSSSSEKTPA